MKARRMAHTIIAELKEAVLKSQLRKGCVDGKLWENEGRYDSALLLAVNAQWGHQEGEGLGCCLCGYGHANL